MTNPDARRPAVSDIIARRPWAKELHERAVDDILSIVADAIACGQAAHLCGARPVKTQTSIWSLSWSLKALDAIADVVLASRPKAKSKAARRRKRRATKLAKKRA